MVTVLILLVSIGIGLQIVVYKVATIALLLQWVIKDVSGMKRNFQ